MTTYHTPLLDYAGYNSTGSSASITGGFVYRGNAYPALRGWYVFGDYSRGMYWTLKRDADTRQLVPQPISTATSPVSFGEGLDGELYVLSFADGTLYHLINQEIVSVQSGNWQNSTTWNCGCVPAGTDTVTVSNSHTVLVNQPVQVKSLLMNGRIRLDGGGKILF